MLFSSYEFLFCFLPITIIGYYLILNAKKVNTNIAQYEEKTTLKLKKIIIII